MAKNEVVFRSNFHFCRKLCRALLARIILVGHSWVTILLTIHFLEDDRFYGLYVYSAVIYIAELVIIIYFNRGCEWNWFCSAFFCYLASTVPALWLQRWQERETEDSTIRNITNDFNASKPFFKLFGNLDESWFDDGRLTSILEQSMMMVLILCRWLLPRGKINRNSMSQLLILYSGISADILDFSELFNQDSDSRNWRLTVLGVWALSLCQFTVIVQTGPLTTLGRDTGTRDTVDGIARETGNGKKSFVGDLFPILMIIFMQDGPFLVARAYTIIEYKVDNYMLYFFTMKNILTLILTFYRLLILCACVSDEGDDLLTDIEVYAKRPRNDV